MLPRWRCLQLLALPNLRRWFVRDAGAGVHRTMSIKLQSAGGIFRQIHEQAYGEALDCARLRKQEHSSELWILAGKVWQQRLQTEYRSVQILVRFLDDMLGAGDPIDTYVGAADMVRDEIHHVSLCAALVTAFGLEPETPSPAQLHAPQAYLKQEPAQRALSTAIAMLAINETISEGYIVDLHERCRHPVIHEVLSRTLGEEETHNAFGWTYIEKSLQRFPKEVMPGLKDLVRQSLQPHQSFADSVISRIPVEKRNLDAWQDTERIELGLFSEQRQALVFQQTFHENLAPKLRHLGLLSFSDEDTAGDSLA
jgi:hypothetical protein